MTTPFISVPPKWSKRLSSLNQAEYQYLPRNEPTASTSFFDDCILSGLCVKPSQWRQRTLNFNLFVQTLFTYNFPWTMGDGFYICSSNILLHKDDFQTAFVDKDGLDRHTYRNSQSWNQMSLPRLESVSILTLHRVMRHSSSLDCSSLSLISTLS